MTLAPIGSPAMSETDARELVDTIRKTVDIAWRQIVRAFEGRAWVALGYESWDELCECEFDGARIRLPREERREVVASLRDAGMSTRAIGAAIGMSDGTVRNDLAGAQDYAPPVPTPADPDDVIVDAEIIEHVEPDPVAAIPRPVTGLDGKSYPAPAPRPAPTPEEQRDRDRAEAIARHARQLERLISLWPYIDDLATAPHRADVIAQIATDHDRELLARIEARISGAPVFGGSKEEA